MEESIIFHGGNRVREYAGLGMAGRGPAWLGAAWCGMARHGFETYEIF